MRVIGSGGEEVPAVPAATVMLLRDGPRGLEVFMMERHLDSDFVGGAYVFPGGKVDEPDLSVDARRRRGMVPLAGVTPEMSVGLQVAAIRETFEEAGVLFARRRGRTIAGDDLDSSSFREARRMLAERGSRWDWRPWLATEELVLDGDALAWWSWWVTPRGVHRRFDTRFFLAALPEGAEPAHDAVETTASRWVRPVDALEAASAGRVAIILPTRKNLQALAGHANTESAMAAARSPGFERPRIEPTIEIATDGVTRVDHPSFDAPEPV